MSAVVDTTVLIDVLRGHEPAVEALTSTRRAGPLHSSVVVRAEVLAGMRADEEDATRSLLSALVWHPVDESLAEEAGEIGRDWLPCHRGISVADLLLAATAIRLGFPLMTTNVRHFPMFPGLAHPY